MSRTGPVSPTNAYRTFRREVPGPFSAVPVRDNVYLIDFSCFVERAIGKKPQLPSCLMCACYTLFVA